MTSPAPLPWVVIYRLQLFKPSETFIQAQAGALRRHRPLHVGWRVMSSPPPGAAAVRPASLRRRVALCVFGDPRDVMGRTGGVRPALVHAHFGVDGVFAMALARRLACPLVVTLHGFDVSRRRWSLAASLRPALLAYVAGWGRLVQRADLLLAVAPAVAEAALNRGVSADRLRVHATGVDLQRLQPRRAGESALIVHVARLVEKKGAGVLLDAFARLAPRWREARLVIVGDGPLRTRLQRQVATLGLADRVQLLGARSHGEALRWMERAAVVVVPSQTAADGDAEGLPTTVLEAAALACPVVASAIPAIVQALRDGEEALLTPPGDAEALSNALGAMLQDPTAAARLGRAARRRIEQEHDLLRQTATLEDRYAQLSCTRG